jgi:ubiquinone/menaquinone biosynthesis C-methylase UbiE
MKELAKEGKGLRVLEVGCGNGWLSAMLFQQGHQVLGIDLFTAELEQAARVFPDGPAFARADLFTSPIPDGVFDIVVFAASIQYFADIDKTLQRALELVRPNGSVHVLDTVLYRDAEAANAAEERSRNYYAKLGNQDMAAHYHAHRLSEFVDTGLCRVISSPSALDPLLRWAGRSVSPFTHVVVHAR